VVKSSLRASGKAGNQYRILGGDGNHGSTPGGPGCFVASVFIGWGGVPATTSGVWAIHGHRQINYGQMGIFPIFTGDPLHFGKRNPKAGGFSKGGPTPTRSAGISIKTPPTIQGGRIHGPPVDQGRSRKRRFFSQCVIVSSNRGDGASKIVGGRTGERNKKLVFRLFRGLFVSESQRGVGPFDGPPTKTVWARITLGNWTTHGGRPRLQTRTRQNLR